MYRGSGGSDRKTQLNYSPVTLRASHEQISTIFFICGFIIHSAVIFNLIFFCQDNKIINRICWRRRVDSNFPLSLENNRSVIDHLQNKSHITFLLSKRWKEESKFGNSPQHQEITLGLSFDTEQENNPSSSKNTHDTLLGRTSADDTD